MKTTYLFAMMLFLTFAFTSCLEELYQESTNELNGEKVPLEITTDKDPGSTRSATLRDAFQETDAIGLFVTDGSLTGTYDGKSAYMNLKSTYTSGKWAQATKVYLSTNNATVFAYAPYDASVTKGAEIPVDVSKQLDYLYGKSDESVTINNSNPTVLLNMSHACSLVQFLIKKENYGGEGKLTKVEIANKSGKTTLYSEGLLNCSTGTITGTSGKNSSFSLQNAQGVIPTLTESFPTETSTSCIKVLVIPTAQTSEVGEIEFRFTIDGKEYVWGGLPVGTQWKKGSKNIYRVTLQGTELSVGGVQIVPWVEDVNGVVQLL